MIRLYLRVSTFEQASELKTSLPEQERRGRGAAMMRGNHSDIEVYTDAGVSGSIPLRDRKAGVRLLTDLRRGDIVIAAKLDRLFRSASDALATVEELDKRGIGVVLADIGPDCVTENGVSKLFFSMLAAFAEFERFRIGERMTDGRLGKRAKGGHIGGQAPYGFRVVGQGREAVLEPVEHEQKVVDLAQQLFGAGKSNRKICAELQRRGLRNRAGTMFQSEQVRRMVRRPMKQAAE